MENTDGKETDQTGNTFFKNPVAFVGAQLNPENRWVKITGLEP
jgi:hypothetical protein